MDQETQKIIAEQMKKLPKDVIEAIISVDYKTKLQEITHRQKLLIDQAGKLEMETTLVMIGLEPLSDYIANIQRELEITNIRAKEIAMDVSENIFKPIRDSLQKMNNEGEKGDSLQVSGDSQTENEAEVTKFTNSNEAELNRDQILKEIENPVLNRPPLRESSVGQAPISTKIEIRPTQELEIAPKQEIKTIPGQGIKDIPVDIVTAKMTGTTSTVKEVINVKTESKLPEVTPKPYKADPYREPLN